MQDTLVHQRTNTRPVSLIGAASGLGARDTRCAGGPEALRAAGLAERLRAGGVQADWRHILTPLPARSIADAIAALCASLADAVRDVLADGHRFAVIGGDHSCAVGAWSGAANALAPRGRLGLIWVDAHMDSHTPDTTPSGTYHGMPVACLLGHGDPALTRIADRAPALAPGHVCLVGVRSYEVEEPALLDRLGVRVFFAEDVARRGIDAVMRDAAAIALDGTAGAGLSVDLDVVDPGEAPGVGSPVAGGLAAAPLVEAVRVLGRDRRFLGCEIAEYNPALDDDGRTAALAGDLVAAFLAGGVS